MSDQKEITPYDHLGYNNNNTNAADIMVKANAIIAKRNVGAISKCTPELIAVLEEAISTGRTVIQACQEAGINDSTYWRWLAIVPGFKDTMSLAHKANATARIYKHQHISEIIDLSEVEPKEQMAYLRKQEQAQRFDMEIAKRRDPATWGDKQINANVNVTVEKADLSEWFNG